MGKFKHICIVEDDETASFVAKILMESFDAADEYSIAKNGKQAVEWIQKTGMLPDFILLDINMPLMNGWEFLDWYEKNGYKGKTKIAMYTSSIRPEDKQKAKGYDDVIGYIEKPITKEKFAEVVDKLAG